MIVSTIAITHLAGPDLFRLEEVLKRTRGRGRFAKQCVATPQSYLLQGSADRVLASLCQGCDRAESNAEEETA